MGHGIGEETEQWTVGVAHEYIHCVYQRGGIEVGEQYAADSHQQCHEQVDESYGWSLASLTVGGQEVHADGGGECGDGTVNGGE